MTLISRSAWAARATARAMRSSDAVSSGSNTRPGAVSSMPCGCLRNSATPRRASSSLTWRLTAPWLTCSSWAARAKLSWRAAASKARSALSGGSRIGDPQLS